MRLIISILLSIGIAFFFGLTAQANDIFPHKAKKLTKYELNAASQEAMNQLCDKQGYMTIPTKTVCSKTVQNSPVSQMGFDYCSDKFSESRGHISGFIECISQLGGADYPLEYLKACETVVTKNFGGNETSSMRKCLQYLASTHSNFDSEAMSLCFKATENDFKRAKPCLNSIRDRQIDVQKMDRECFPNGRSDEDTLSCIEKIADVAPLSNPCDKSLRTPSSLAPKAIR